VRPVRGQSVVVATPPALGPAPQVKFGYLSADADPWADVLIDGRRLERTPLSRYPVTVGPHTLVFRAADGRQQTRKIKVEEGQLVSESATF